VDFPTSHSGILIFASAAAVLSWALPQSFTGDELTPGKSFYDFSERQVTFRNEKDGITLSATLTLPYTSQPTTAVILIPNCSLDRDAAAGRHRLFQTIAANLAHNGIISLRADSRGIGQSQGMPWPGVTKNEIASDIRAAWDFLKQQPEVDTAEIGLIGHSEGASIALMMAARSSGIAFVVMLAGPGLPGSDVLCSQIRSVAAAFGVGKPTIEKHVRLMQEAALILAEHPDKDKARAELLKAHNAFLSRTSGEERRALRACGYSIAEHSEEFAAGLLLPWMKDFLLYDPRPDLQNVRCPALSLIGEKDLQVNAEANSAAIREALNSGGNPHTQIIILPGLNHLLQTAKTGSPAEYQDIDEAISPVALNTVSDWILSLPGIKF